MKCLSNKNSDLPLEEMLSESPTLSSILKFMRRVSLKLPQVKMKLGVGKVIHFLEKCSCHRLSDTAKDKIEANKVESICEFTQFERENIEEEDKENVDACNQPESFKRMETSRSISERNCFAQFSPFPINEVGNTQIKTLNFRQVVTKNALDEPQIPQHLHVKFISQIGSLGDGQQTNQMIQKLQQENNKLQKCLQSILNFFEEKRLLKIEGSLHDIGIDGYRPALESLTQNFIAYQQQIGEEIANLSAKSSLLQETVHNMSISLRIEKQTSKEKICSTAIQTEKWQDVEMCEIMREKETLLLLRDQQLASLRTVVSDLENKLKQINTSTIKNRSKGYKRFFDITGENLSRTE